MPLTLEEKHILLRLAREALEKGVRGEKLPPLDWEHLPAILRAPGASFVTLTKYGELRGCIGTLEARQPLAEDVREHALAAALNDYRFPPVEIQELSEIEIEISILTEPVRLEYSTPQELIAKLRPGIDGVVLQEGGRRATFLPQVWAKVPDPEEFLSQLCMKMGTPPDLWKKKPLEVFVYQVEEFRESHDDEPSGSRGGRVSL